MRVYIVQSCGEDIEMVFAAEEDAAEYCERNDDRYGSHVATLSYDEYEVIKPRRPEGQSA